MYTIKNFSKFFSFELLRILKCVTERECVTNRVRRFAKVGCKKLNYFQSKNIQYD